LRGHVEGPTAADAEIDAAGFDQRLHLGLDEAELWWRCGDHKILQQALALRQV
jgi:hypothetical protein